MSLSIILITYGLSTKNVAIILSIFFIPCAYCVCICVSTEYAGRDTNSTGEQVSNFEECASAGNPIMESFPRQCADGGKTFTEGVLYNDSGNEIVPDGAIFGKVEIGPFCPVEREGVPCNPPTEAYTSRIARLYDSTGTHVIEWRNIKDDGTFEFSPPPGEYYVDVYPGGMGPVEKQWVEVVSDEGTGVLIVIDTGIR